MSRSKILTNELIKRSACSLFIFLKLFTWMQQCIWQSAIMAVFQVWQELRIAGGFHSYPGEPACMALNSCLNIQAECCRSIWVERRLNLIQVWGLVSWCCCWCNQSTAPSAPRQTELPGLEVYADSSQMWCFNLLWQAYKGAIKCNFIKPQDTLIFVLLINVHKSFVLLFLEILRNI